MRLRTGILVAVAAAFLTFASESAAGTSKTNDSKQIAAKLHKSLSVKAFWNGQGRHALHLRYAKCWDVPLPRQRAVCAHARESLRVHEKRARKLRRQLWLTIPNTNDWVTAVKLAQRPFPQTERRLFAISDHEGGDGPWVWWAGICGDPPCLWRGYHVGNDPWGDDTVGGPVQFRYSTFIIYWPDAKANLERRGFKIPDLGWARPYVVAGASTGYGPWLSPLGQALTAAYMHWSGRQGCHWCGVP